MPKISVIIPLYNKAAYIKRAMDSVLAQTEQDFEIIVVDDGSTDGGGRAVKSYSDARIKYISQENFGVSVARNVGVKHTLAEYVSFLDADDEYLPRFIEVSLGFVKSVPILSGVFTNLISAHDKLPWFTSSLAAPVVIDNYLAFLSENNGRGATSSSIIVQKEKLIGIGGFPVGIVIGEDLDTWFRLTISGKLGCVSEPLAIYHNELQSVDGFRAPVFPQIVKTIRKFSEEGKILSSFIPESLKLENLYLIYYVRELTDCNKWADALKTLFCECQLKYVPKKHLLVVLSRLITKYMLNKSAMVWMRIHKYLGVNQERDI